MTMLGPTSFKKAIEEAEKLSESLKLRLEALVVFAYTAHTFKHLIQKLRDRTAKLHQPITFVFPTLFS